MRSAQCGRKADKHTPFRDCMFAQVARVRCEEQIHCQGSYRRNSWNMLLKSSVHRRGVIPALSKGVLAV